MTQITTVKLPPDKQDEVLELMTERAQFMATQPGFVSISLHRSKDGSHVVNYMQWTTSRQAGGRASFAGVPQEMAAVRQDRAKKIEPCLYEVVHIEAASMAAA